MANPAQRRQQNGKTGQQGAGPADGLTGGAARGPEGGQDGGAPTEVLAGSIERITFHNPCNGFCVLRIKARGHRDLVTVIGHAAEISAGEWVTVSGVVSALLTTHHR